jgi:hypothetical protein
VNIISDKPFEKVGGCQDVIESTPNFIRIKAVPAGAIEYEIPDACLYLTAVTPHPGPIRIDVK